MMWRFSRSLGGVVSFAVLAVVHGCVHGPTATAPGASFCGPQSVLREVRGSGELIAARWCENSRGVPKGELEAFHPGGQLGLRGHLVKGAPEGTWWYWDQSGRLLAEVSFLGTNEKGTRGPQPSDFPVCGGSHGAPKSSVDQDTNHITTWCEQRGGVSGPFAVFAPERGLVQIGALNKGMETGLWVSFLDDGVALSRRHDRANVGPSILFESGQAAMIEFYDANGRVIGADEPRAP